MRSEIMTLAAQNRRMGMNPSDALTSAWENALELRPTRRRRRNPSAEGSALGSIILLGGVGTVVWKLVKKSWPWETMRLQKLQAIAQRQVRSRALITQAKTNQNVNGLYYQPFDWHKSGGVMGDSPPVLVCTEPDKPQSVPYTEEISIIDQGFNSQKFLSTYKLPPFRINN